MTRRLLLAPVLGLAALVSLPAPAATAGGPLVCVEAYIAVSVSEVCDPTSLGADDGYVACPGVDVSWFGWASVCVSRLPPIG